MAKLLTRDEFRVGVFTRDAFKCVLCGDPAVDAHHIIERKLWPDGGYYLENGASVCAHCHMKCEQTTVSCDRLREVLNVPVLLPEHLYADQSYDKWGNPIMANGRRCLGELMDDESVRKVLKEGGFWPNAFDTRIKYPRTYHLPWSPGLTDDDRQMPDLKNLLGSEVVITVKMDGENTSMARDGVYARSRDTESHWSRDWVRGLHGRIAHEIPDDWRLCGENLFATHSIKYDTLPSFFLGFSIWQRLSCLPWDDTVAYFDMLGIKTVPVLYRGLFNEEQIQSLRVDEHEGYVVRPTRAFHMNEFRKVVGKYVRANHNQCHGGWHRSAERNKLA